ncbi:MAG: DUF433 domain-containing protein [Dehalococcoidia bacterium]
MKAPTIDINGLLDIDPFNGKPVIRGGRLRVITIAARHAEGRTPEEIATEYPNLSVSAVYAALAYYFEHRQAMDEEESRECEEALAWAKANGAEIIYT